MYNELEHGWCACKTPFPVRAPGYWGQFWAMTVALAKQGPCRHYVADLT